MRFSLLLAAAVSAVTAAAQIISTSNGTYKLSGLRLTDEPAAGWQSIFRVYSGSDSSQAVLGTYSLEGGDLLFRPRFPQPESVAWHAGYFPDGSTPSVTEAFGSAAKKAATRIEHVYPSSGVLPGNVLKLYICFSAPMSRGEAWQHIHLLDEAGQAVPLAFLEIDQELWDPEQRRLTVLFDPGRIKRGLVPASELGTPIVEGRRYTLAIDRGWHDARGVGLVEDFRRTFRGGPIDREPADPRLWRITAPEAGTLEPLVVDFPKPMDYALLQRLIEVPGVEGSISIERDETRWVFTPREAWKAGSYHLAAKNALEDIAGNRLNRPFDVDLQDSAESLSAAPETMLPFVVRPN